MATIRKADPSKWNPSQPRAGSTTKEMSPAAQERQKQQGQLRRMIGKLQSPDDVFEVRMGGDEKGLTVRQRLLKVAQDMDKNIAVRKTDKGFLVGLMTPERRSRRGRRPKSETAGAAR